MRVYVADQSLEFAIAQMPTSNARVTTPLYSLFPPFLDNSIYSLAPPMDIRRERRWMYFCSGRDSGLGREIDIKRILSVRRSGSRRFLGR